MTKNIKYDNSKVYKIIGTDPEDKFYIGSTTNQYLSQRLTAHIYQYGKFKEGDKRRFVTSFLLFDKYGVKNCKIILLENCNVKSKDELRAREQKYIDESNCVNQVKAYLTTEQKKERDLKYIKSHKEERRLVDQLYRAKNQEKKRAQDKQYYEDNKEECRRKHKLYALENGAALKAKKTEVVFCAICNCDSTKNNIATHNKSQKHLNNIKKEEL